MSNLVLGPKCKGEALPCLIGPPLPLAICHIPHDESVLADRLSPCHNPQKPSLGQPNLLGDMAGSAPPMPLLLFLAALSAARSDPLAVSFPCITNIVRLSL